MTNALDLAIGSGRVVADAVFAPLGDTMLTVIDVGARNGMFRLPASYAAHAALVGFEPNPEEHAKLLSRSTDAIVGGSEMPRFRREVFHDCAVWDREEERPFFVTAGVGASTMMGEA